MPNTCSAYKCTNRKEKGGKTFHSFPLHDKELTQKWVVAMKRDAFLPNESSRLCNNHFKPNDSFFKFKKLELNAVPSLFDFPAHLTTACSKRKKPARREDPQTSTRKKNQKLLKNQYQHQFLNHRPRES